MAGRLEIKPAQQTAWDEFSRSVETLAEWHAKEPGDETDAATILHYRAARVSVYARKLTIVADASAKLEAVLTDEQRKTFNQASRRFLHDHHGRHHFHEQSRENGQRVGGCMGTLKMIHPGMLLSAGCNGLGSVLKLGKRYARIRNPSGSYSIWRHRRGILRGLNQNRFVMSNRHLG